MTAQVLRVSAENLDMDEERFVNEYREMMQCTV
jgi:hypothetical protein